MFILFIELKNEPTFCAVKSLEKKNTIEIFDLALVIKEST